MESSNDKITCVNVAVLENSVRSRRHLCWDKAKIKLNLQYFFTKDESDFQ